MVPLSLWSISVSIAMAGGLTASFRKPDPTPFHAGLLLFTGLISALSTLALVRLSSDTNTLVQGLVIVIAAPLPALLSIQAGLGFRRAWHTGLIVFGVFAVLIYAALLSHTAGVRGEAFALWVDPIYKLIMAGLLLHALSSFWHGREDDMDLIRRSKRLPLAALYSVTLFAVLLLNPRTPLIAGLLSLCWLAAMIAIQTMRTRTNTPDFDTFDEKLNELKGLIDRRRIYRESDLTLERIGDRLLLDNREVRQLVSIGLGFRRLSDLLDHHRIESAKVILDDPDQADMRLEEVAISVGYGSLAPFMAAFDRLNGKTARDYRQGSLDQANANRPLQLTNTDR